MSFNKKEHYVKFTFSYISEKISDVGEGFELLKSPGTASLTHTFSGFSGSVPCVVHK
jgi:hypothetical protein